MLKGMQFSEKELCSACIFAVHLSVLSTWDLMLEDLERIGQLGLVWNIDNRGERIGTSYRIKNRVSRDA